MQSIVVYEHELLAVDKLLSPIQLDALARFNDRNSGKYFQILHRAIRFKNYVGIIQLDCLQIEVLPKMDKDQLGSPLRAALLSLLEYCELLKIEYTGPANLAIEQESITTLYIRAFLQAVEILMQKGLSRTYEQKIVHSKHWKGQVQLRQQLRLDYLKRPYLISQQISYSYENRWHQLLYLALRQLLEMPIRPKLQSWAQRLLLDFPPQKPGTLQPNDFKNLYFDQKRLPYKNAMQLAEFILLGFQPQLKAGESTVFGLLFDMNRLFEEYVYRQIYQALEDGEVLERQTSSVFWAEKELKPDLILKIGAKRLVMDCKWKILEKAEPSDQDLRQIYVYQQHFEAEEGWLLYPSVTRKAPFVEPFSTITGAEPPARAAVLWLNLLNADGSLNRNLGKELLQQARATIS